MEQITIQDIVDYLEELKFEPELIGKTNTIIKGFSSLNHYKHGTFTWIKNEKSLESAKDFNNITLVIAPKGLLFNAANIIYTTNPKSSFFKTIEHFYEQKKEGNTIGSGTYISQKTKVGLNVIIGSNCVLDGDIVIGDDTVIGHNVSIVNRVSIGKRCTIDSGTVIGTDGFGYVENEKHEKNMVKHFGGVIIGNDVHIASNTNVNRGTIDDTIIGNGVVIDGLCHIGHNVILEDNCAVIAGTVFFGSVYVERNTYISTSVIKNQCRIGENSFIGMGSVVIRDVPLNTTVAGNPAKPINKNDN